MSLKTALLKALLRSGKVTYYAPIVLQYHGYYKYERRDKEKWKFNRNTGFVLLGSILVGSAGNVKQKESKDAKEVFEAGAKRQDLPTFTAEEVSKHDNKKSFWVTYKHGVYDVTSFLPSHPGGEQIYNAAGLSIEPFWNVYGMHKTDEVYRLLESYRIGNLHDNDVLDHSDDELWAKEPYRDERLIVKTAKPFNAEIPPKLQVQHFDTPNELFYVRQHMPVPDLDARTHKLTVHVVGEHTRVTELSLDELHSFRPATLSAALMCAGNRRSEMNKVKPVKGLSWTTGAISNAQWGGVYLRDVLIHCGVDVNDVAGKHVIVKPVKGLSWTTGAISNAQWGGVYLRDVLIHCGVDVNDVAGKHVIFTGSDIDATGVNFSTSIPLHMALDPNSAIVLATSMNGAPLPPDHGYPLRVVVPGAPAVRSVKWLQSITISTEESGSHWHQKDYRSFNPSTTWETADFPSAPPVYSLPVTSAICDPEDGDTVAPSSGQIEVKGYAYSGGGAAILRVDVSCDRGRTWRAARLQRHAAAPRTHYAWTLWTIALPVDEATQMEIWVKATDSNFNTQPENFDDIWNIRGILSNAYHKIKVNIKR